MFETLLILDDKKIWKLMTFFCIWLEVKQEKCKPFLIGNMYRPPDSRIEFNDRLEAFIDNIFKESKETI